MNIHQLILTLKSVAKRPVLLTVFDGEVAINCPSLNASNTALRLWGIQIWNSGVTEGLIKDE